MSESKASIVIPVYNGAKTIGPAIEAALTQDMAGGVEVVVVDDGSVDGTADVVKAFSGVRYVFQENAGPAAARNRGAQEARGEFLFFTDADCIPPPDWISRMIPEFADPSIAVVAGGYDLANGEVLLARCIQREISFRHENLVGEHPLVFGSYNFGIRRSVFDELRGFNVRYRHASGEDNDLGYRVRAAGHRIRFLPSVRVGHHHPVHLPVYLKEQYRHGFWRVLMYMDHPARAGGDGYTFWKDIVEIPLVLAVFVGLWPALWGLIFLELTFGLKTSDSLKEGLYSSWVMLLRSFSRTLGFLSGIFLLPLKKVIK